MSEIIEQGSSYAPAAPSQEPAEAAAVQPGGNPVLRALTSARRHWLMVLLAWILVAVPSAVGIWTFLKPTYIASADVEILPRQTPILYPDVNTPVSSFDAYLTTQSETIAGTEVLHAALADPTLRGLPLLAEPEPVAALRSALTAKVIPRSYILRVSVEQRDPEAAKLLAKAVVKAYETIAVDNDRVAQEKQRKILSEERTRLRRAIQEQRDAIARIAQQFQAANEDMYTVLRDGVIKSSVQTRAELERAKIQRSNYQSQLTQLEQGLVPTTTPSDDINWREQYIENDGTVRRLRMEIDAEKWQVLRFGANPAREKRIAALEAQLAELRTRVGEEADARLRERHAAMLEHSKRRIAEDVKALDALIANLERDLEAQKDEGMQMGQASLEIRRLQEESEFTKNELERVEEKLRALEIESRREARIKVSNTAEILPDGVKDRRVKLIPVAVIGALGLAMGLAFLRDLATGRLYAARDIESQVGLRLLGALPSLEDLHRGRVTDDDFRESYRAIRATLAGISPDGRVPRHILVTSAQAAEGKTSLAISLAAGLAEGGQRVLIVDGDVQAPRIAQTLHLKGDHGLRQVLTGERSLAEAVGPTSLPTLEVLLSGRNGHSAEGMLTSEAAAALLKDASERYDHVIIDSPPVLGAADALIWAQNVHGVVIASFAGYSNLGIIRHACEQLFAAGGRILGTVVSNVSFRDRYVSYSTCSSARSCEPDGGGSDQGPRRRPPCIQMGGKMLLDAAPREDDPHP